jgi:exopolysaccharide biosynthesis polyprenyl glycosylphosphotransferase
LSTSVRQPRPPVRGRRPPGDTVPMNKRTREILERHDRANACRRTRQLTRLLIVADCLGLAAALVVTRLVYPGDSLVAGRYSNVAELTLFAATLPCWLVVANLYGLYSRDAQRADHSTADDAAAVLNMVTLGAWLLYVVARVTGAARVEPSKLIAFWAAAIVAILVARALARLIARRSIAFVQNSIIVGAGSVGQLVGRKLLQHPEYGINPVGFVDDHPEQHDGDRLGVLGETAELPELIRRFDIERVIVAFNSGPYESTLRAVRGLADQGVQVDIVPRLYEVVGAETTVHAVEGLPLLSVPPAGLSWSSRALKRALDLVVASVALLILAPLFALVAVLIKLDSRGPAFFRQPRIGENGRPFRIWKFRTMTVDADERKSEYAHLNMHEGPNGGPRMFKIPDDPRVTRVGRVLRRFSLDEFPQLLNVLGGEMSLVGPRPLIPDEHRFVTDWAERRLALRPGMTGLWQVLGRNGIPFDEMVRLDYVYVNTWSLWNDLRLMARTIPVVFGGNGRY